VRPELVAKVTYLTWTADGLLRHVVYEGLREDKSPRGMCDAPHRALSGATILQQRFVILKTVHPIDTVSL
jgi:ATP-dependent DNA ligase